MRFYVGSVCEMFLYFICHTLCTCVITYIKLLLVLLTYLLANSMFQIEMYDEIFHIQIKKIHELFKYFKTPF